MTVGLALLGAPVLAASVAQAMPLDRAITTSGLEDQVKLVRDGCGRGFRFSNRRQACVPMDQGQRGYVDPGAAAAVTAIGVIGAIVGTGTYGYRRNVNRGGNQHHRRRR